MIQIRKNIFETNSSSCHSLIMLKEDSPLDTPIDDWRVRDDGVMFMYDYHLEFGRGFDVLNDWYGRLCYAIASYRYDEEMIDYILELARKHIRGLKEFKFSTDDEGKPYYGYIDHQSHGLLNEFLSQYYISLEDFIFNNRFIVIIDGDEYRIFDSFRALPTWNKNAVKHIMEAI